MVIEAVGASCFGFVVGWITYRTLRRKTGVAALSDIATVIGALGGAGVTAHFGSEVLFGWYSVGLAVGFVLYFIIGLNIKEDQDVKRWMGD